MKYKYKSRVDSLSVTTFSPCHSQVTNMTSIHVCYPRTRCLRLWQRCGEVWFVRISSRSHVRVWKPTCRLSSPPQNLTLFNFVLMWLFSLIENPNGFKGVNNYNMSSVYIQFIHWDNTQRLINNYTVSIFILKRRSRPRARMLSISLFAGGKNKNNNMLNINPHG